MSEIAKRIFARFSSWGVFVEDWCNQGSSWPAGGWLWSPERSQEQQRVGSDGPCSVLLDDLPWEVEEYLQILVEQRLQAKPNGSSLRSQLNFRHIHRKDLSLQPPFALGAASLYWLRAKCPTLPSWYNRPKHPKLQSCTRLDTNQIDIPAARYGTNRYIHVVDQQSLGDAGICFHCFREQWLQRISAFVSICFWQSLWLLPWAAFRRGTYLAYTEPDSPRDRFAQLDSFCILAWTESSDSSRNIFWASFEQLRALPCGSIQAAIHWDFFQKYS